MADSPSNTPDRSSGQSGGQSGGQKKKRLTPAEVQENIRDAAILANVDNYRRQGLTQTDAMERVARNLHSSGKFNITEARDRVKTVAGGSLASPTDPPPPAALDPLPSVTAREFKPTLPAPNPDADLLPTANLSSPYRATAISNSIAPAAPIPSSPAGAVPPAFKESLLVQAIQLAQTKLKSGLNQLASLPPFMQPPTNASPYTTSRIGTPVQTTDIAQVGPLTILPDSYANLPGR